MVLNMVLQSWEQATGVAIPFYAPKSGLVTRLQLPVWRDVQMASVLCAPLP